MRVIYVLLSENFQQRYKSSKVDFPSTDEKVCVLKYASVVANGRAFVVENDHGYGQQPGPP